MSATATKPLTLARRASLAAALLLVSVPAAPASAGTFDIVSPPAGFEDLARPRELLVDVYFGGRKIGEALATSSPGSLRFHDPDTLLSFLPGIADASELRSVLSKPLPTNSGLVCSQSNHRNCGEVEANPLGIIFDEAKFRVNLFIAPSLLSSAKVESYLPSPAGQFSVTSSIGLAVSGTTSNATSYNLQNRTIAAFRSARVRSDSSFASGVGLLIDDLLLEVDRPDIRYSAGLFWAPGVELIGNRRILGVGVGTQFDTRLDREILQGTPLVLSLTQPSRVEILVDGRLLDSGVYQAGNTVLDTATLPTGSYPVLLRIYGPAGTVREERRFFIKNAHIPPVGEPVYSAYAGVLANTRSGKPLSPSRTFFYQLGTARRVSEAVAADLSVVGTQENAILQAGGWLMMPAVRARVAGLVSTRGDRGVLLQAASTTRGGLNFTFDLRKIWNKSRQALIPLNAHVETFSSRRLPHAHESSGSYTQAVGSLGYSVGPARLSLIGSLRSEAGGQADYSIGADVNWAVTSFANWQVVLQADTQLTRSSRSSFVGARLFWRAGPVSIVGTGGSRRLARGGGDKSRNRGVWSVVGQYSHESDDRTQLAVAAGVDRDLQTTTAHGSGTAYSSWGKARADVVQHLEGDGGTQFGLTLHSAAAVTPIGIGIGGRDLAESAVIVAAEGSGEAAFDVLFDEVRRGRLDGRRPLTVFVQPYRRYNVRLRPVGSAAVNYDSDPRDVVVYPGSVQHIRWRTEAVLTVFGQAILPGGTPLKNATVQSRRGIGQTDENGYFQIDITEQDVLAFSSSEGHSCGVDVKAISPGKNFARLGKVVCR